LHVREHVREKNSPKRVFRRIFVAASSGEQSMKWQGYSAAAVGSYPELKRGAPVLGFASHTLKENKTLVCFLVWSNPENMQWASRALQADAEVVAAALSSPFYDEPWDCYSGAPRTCVLENVRSLLPDYSRNPYSRNRNSRAHDNLSPVGLSAKTILEDKDTVLLALARSGYEFEFASETLRADAYVAAWAGSPVGSFSSRCLSKTFMRTLKSGVTVEHVDAFSKVMLEDNDILSSRVGDRPLRDVLNNWPTLDNKHNYAAYIKSGLEASCPLCLRVAPDARELLWPTCEAWDGVF